MEGRRAAAKSDNLPRGFDPDTPALKVATISIQPRSPRDQRLLVELDCTHVYDDSLAEVMVVWDWLEVDHAGVLLSVRPLTIFVLTAELGQRSVTRPSNRYTPSVSTHVHIFCDIT